MGRINRRRDRWLKRGLETTLRPFLRRRPCGLAEIEAARPQRILIVRQHNQMGDMLCAVPAFRAIHLRFPKARKLLITAPVNHGVVDGNPYLDGILLFDKTRIRSSPQALWSFWRQLRGFRADLAFVLNSVSFSGTSAWLAVLSGARHIVGGDSTPFGWSFSRWLYNLEMPSNPIVEGHAIDHQLEPLRAIGIDCSDRSTVVRPRPEAVSQATAFLEAIGPRPRVALHPGAGKAENRWPAERFAEIARRLRASGATVFLIEGPADGVATREALSAAGEEFPVLRDVSLAVVAAAVGGCEFALVNDTGVMHVAGAMGTPSLALFGPTPMACWKPPSETMTAIQSPDGRMDSIDLEAVWIRIRERVLTNPDPTV